MERVEGPPSFVPLRRLMIETSARPSAHAAENGRRMMEDACRGPTILTAGGTYFNFERPELALFDIEDIATGLSNTCRFGGQCSRFYSVAEHSVYVSFLVDRPHQLAALLHDAAEAFIGDMPKPLKELLPDYKAVEARVEAVVFSRFGLPTALHPSIKHADRQMLAAEQQQIMFNHDDWEWTHSVEPADIHVMAYGPSEAKQMFMDRYRVLSGGAGQ